MNALYNTEQEIQDRIAYLRKMIDKSKNDYFLIYGYCREIQELQNKIAVGR